MRCRQKLASRALQRRVLYTWTQASRCQRHRSLMSAAASGLACHQQQRRIWAVWRHHVGLAKGVATCQATQRRHRLSSAFAAWGKWMHDMRYLCSFLDVPCCAVSCGDHEIDQIVNVTDVQHTPKHSSKLCSATCIDISTDLGKEPCVARLEVVTCLCVRQSWCCHALYPHACNHLNALSKHDKQTTQPKTDRPQPWEK